MPRGFSWLWTAALAFAASSCTSASSSLSVAAPTSAKCQITASTSRASFGASGGSGAVTISAERECQWAVQPAVTWIALDGAASGQGAATLNFGVSANGAASVRKGAIVVAGSSLEITQDAAPCRYSLDRSTASIGADGGSLTVSVGTLAGCAWTVSTDAAWMTIATARDGNGSGSAQVAVAPNAGSGARVGHVTIANQAVVVSQQAKAATPPPTNPSPGSPSPPPAPPSSPPPAPPSPPPQPSPAPTPPPDDHGGKKDDGGDEDKRKDPKHGGGKDKKDKGGKDKGKHAESGVLAGNRG